MAGISNTCVSMCARKYLVRVDEGIVPPPPPPPVDQVHSLNLVCLPSLAHLRSLPLAPGRARGSRGT